jgi:hypothetical protein
LYQTVLAKGEVSGDSMPTPNEDHPLN